MQSDPEEVRKSVRSYIIVFVALMVFTVITVAASRFHFAVPIAITIALIIAAMKGSMVAGVFMHLSHEKKLIYGSLLLTALFFIVLMFVPLLTQLDHIGVSTDRIGAGARAGRSAPLMSLRAFHLFFIAVSVALAAFFAAWAASQYRAQHDLAYALAGVGAVAVCGALIAYGAAFQRKTRHLLVALMCLAVPRAAYACPVCFGQSDSPMAAAANLSILVMLVITVAMLVAFASFFIVLFRRARAAAALEGSAEAGLHGGPAKAGLHVRRLEC